MLNNRQADNGKVIEILYDFMKKVSIKLDIKLEIKKKGFLFFLTKQFVNC